METSEFTKKCELAYEALHNVLQEIDSDNEDVYDSLSTAANVLSNLAISEGPFIGRSVMKCLLIEAEEESNSLEEDQESLQYRLRDIRLLFDAMDDLEITRMNKNAFDQILSTLPADEYTIKLFAESDKAKKEDYKSIIEEIRTARPDYFEDGNPESIILCDESCRGTEKVLSREQLGKGITCITTTRSDKCLYEDWL